MKIVWQKGKMNVPKEYDQNDGWIVATLAQEMLKDAFYEYGGKLIAIRRDENIKTLEYEYKAQMAFALNPQETDQSADYQPLRHGKWIWDDEGYHCSECFYHAYGETGSILSNEWSYCPNCGAKMERSEE